MFEGGGTRVGDLLLRGLDCALEFATLGEYRLGTPAAVGEHEPDEAASGPLPRPAAKVVPPATAAGRRLQAGSVAAADPRNCEWRAAAGRRRGADPARRARARGGATPRPPQAC